MAYGVNRGSRLKIDYDLVDRLQDVKINTDKLIEGLFNSEPNKETATYFIYMKKLARNSQKVPGYICSDSFDPTFIQHVE